MGILSAVADTTVHSSDVVVEGDVNSATINVGGSVDVKYWITATKQTQCDASDGSSVVITLLVPGGVTASPSSLTFARCGPQFGQQVTFSSSVANPTGYLIPVDVSDADPADNSKYRKDPATYTLYVLPPSDTDAPVLTVPPDITGVEATGPTGASVSFVVSAIDAVDGDRPVSCSIGSGPTTPITSPYTFPLGISAVLCTTSDLSGNTAEAGFNVEVVDTTDPSITAPPDVSAETTGEFTEVALGEPVVSDLVTPSSEIIVTNDAPVGGFPLGTTIVTWTATDGAGNSATATQTVFVKVGTQISDLAVAFHSNGRYVVTGELQNSNTDAGLRDQPISITFSDGTSGESVNTDGVEIVDASGISVDSCTIGPSCPPDGGVADPNSDGLNVLLQVHEDAEIAFTANGVRIEFLGLDSEDVVLCRDACGDPEEEFTVATTSAGPSSIVIGSDTYGPTRS